MFHLLAPLFYRNTTGSLLNETRQIRSFAAQQNGEIVDLYCIDSSLRSLKQLESGIDEDAWALREYALSNGGQIVDFTCINKGIEHLKSIEV
ncbi:MAG: hypothetical protein EP346_00110 [Bacteroidetes bacterium]|nr:MAG: hypothetical protein EP346_00110 [Bacteroidota bacterium]